MTTYRRNYASQRAGFTLVEILVVIVIIGLLAGMTTTVVVSARRSVNASVISSQEAQLSIALDEYKNRYGEYPPDFSDTEAVVRHVKKRWPRMDLGSGTTDQLFANFMIMVREGCALSSGGYVSGDSALSSASSLDQPDSGTNFRHVWDFANHASALIFWLGGLPNSDGVPCGFYASPKYPLGINYSKNEAIARPERAKREKPLFLFDKKSIGALAVVDFNGTSACYVDSAILKSNDVVKRYMPVYLQGGYPVLYFRPTSASSYLDKGFAFADSDDPTSATLSFAVPYARTMNNGAPEWYEESRFQLVHPGADGLFGDGVSPRVLQPKNGSISLADDDNVTNFVDSGTLVSEYQETIN